MFAVILAGGRGTRMRPYTHTIPKPLLPLGDRPVLDILLHRLKHSGVRHVVLCLGYLAPLISAFVKNGEDWGLQVSCVVEKSPLGTAGPLRLVPDLPDDFLVVNGDTLTDLDFAGMYAEHRRSGAWATAFAPEIEDKADYGILDIDEKTGAIRDYIEKPTRKMYVSSGVYVLAKRLVEAIPEGRHFDMPDLVRYALTNGRPVAAFRAQAYWRDIGRMDHFEMANRDFEADMDHFLGTG